MSNYFKINRYDTANGEGLRMTIFFTGCHFACKDCFNSEIWDFNIGKNFNNEVLDKIIALSDEHIRGLSILGGEPLHPRNIEEVAHLVYNFKKVYPSKDIWLWTGFTYEELNKINLGEKYKLALNSIFKYIDVLVDGRFELDKKDLNLKWRGSSNQRVIDIQKTLEKNEIVLYCE